MHGKFDTTMVAANPLEVCGPIKWTGDEAYDLEASSLEVLAVAVFQPTTDGQMIFGYTVTPVAFTNPTDLEWETHVPAQAGARWRAGLAFAIAVVRLTEAARPERLVYERWCETITLLSYLEDVKQALEQDPPRA